jgi:hypothetical protein
MEIIFNELSLQNLPETRMEADRAMRRWIELLENIQKTVKSLDLRSTILLKEALISSDLPLMEWLKKNKEKAAFFLGLITKKEIVHNYPDYFWNQTRCFGLAYAYETDTASISYNGITNWFESRYTLNKQFIDEKANQFQETDIVVRHIGTQEHIRYYEDWLKSFVVVVKLLSNTKRFQKTPYKCKGQLIYRELETNYYWYYDSFHRDAQEKDAKILTELEVCDAQGIHIGTADAQSGVLNVENRVPGRSIKRYLK